MERFFRAFKQKEEKPAEISLVITDHAKNHLVKLMTRPNPKLAEFMFLGLGKEGIIDQILVSDENRFLNKGIVIVGGVVKTSVNEDDYLKLLENLVDSGREEEVLVFGHTHPTGTFRLGGTKFIVEPSYEMLIPSNGVGNDVRFAKELMERLTMIPRPYYGIAAETEDGPKLRVYKTHELARVKKVSQIHKLSQATLSL